MAKSNRNHFNPNAHMYQQEACKRDAFEELMGSGSNSAVFATIAQNGKEAVKELRSLNRQFARFRSDIVPLCNNIMDFLELSKPAMTAEDFSWYQRSLPGLFFFLGLGDTPALHADDFQFDETILTKGADFFEHLAEEFQ